MWLHGPRKRYHLPKRSYLDVIILLAPSFWMRDDISGESKIVGGSAIRIFSPENEHGERDPHRTCYWLVRRHGSVTEGDPSSGRPRWSPIHSTPAIPVLAGRGVESDDARTADPGADPRQGGAASELTGHVPSE